jgi:hypothetical protein
MCGSSADYLSIYLSLTHTLSQHPSYTLPAKPADDEFDPPHPKFETMPSIIVASLAVIYCEGIAGKHASLGILDNLVNLDPEHDAKP